MLKLALDRISDPPSDACTFRVWATALVLALTAPSAQAEIFADIDLEDAVIESNWNINDGGYSFPLNDSGDQYLNGPLVPELHPWTHEGFGRSLKVEMPPGSKTQRCEWYTGTRGHPFGEWRWMGTRLAVHEDSEYPRHFTILTQFHQGQPEKSSSPQVALLLSERTDGWFLRVIGRNSEFYSGGLGTGPRGGSFEIWEHPIEKGQWYSLEIGVNFNGSGATPGGVKIYFEDEIVVDWTGDIGYPESFLGYFYPQKFFMKSGVYRGSQSGHLRVHFDDYRFATSYEEVRVAGRRHLSPEFRQWLQEHGMDPAEIDLQSDGDDDGKPLILEYLLGGDPDDRISPYIRPHLPVDGLSQPGFEFEYLMVDPDLHHQIEVTEGLLDWQAIGEVPASWSATVIDPDPLDDGRYVTYRVSPSALPFGFLRVRAGGE